MGAIVGIVIAGFVLTACLLALMLIWLLRKRPQEKPTEPPMELNSKYLGELEIGELLGKGSFGEVYRGKLGEHLQVAVCHIFFF